MPYPSQSVRMNKANNCYNEYRKRNRKMLSTAGLLSKNRENKRMNRRTKEKTGTEEETKQVARRCKGGSSIRD